MTDKPITAFWVNFCIYFISYIINPLIILIYSLFEFGKMLKFLISCYDSSFANDFLVGNKCV